MPGRQYVVACALALALLLAAYANHFRNDFHFDDAHTIQNNLYIRDLGNIPQFFTNPATFSALPTNQSYRPLVTTTLAIDYRLGGGLDPFMFHVTSFAMFVLECVVLVGLYRRLMDHARPHAWNRWLALFAATWFAVHTANAETVNYIISRSDLLSTLCTVIAVWMYALGGLARRWHLYLIPAAAGVLAKEQGAMVAPILFVYAAFFERNLSIRDLVKPRHALSVLGRTWPAFVLCGAIVVMGMSLATTFTPGGTSRWAYLITQPFVLLHYALSFVLPMNLSADTDWTAITNPFDDRVLIGLAFIAGALWTAVVTSRRRETRPIAFGILWFFLALAPTSSLVPLAEVMNDHRMHFPFVGLTLAAVWAMGLALMTRERPLAARPAVATLLTVAAVTLLVAHAYGTRQRNIVWRTEESLWRDVTIKSPANGRGLMTYGVMLMGKGDYDGAQDYFDRAMQYTPRYAYLHVNLGVLKSARGAAADAERHFLDAQRYAANDPVSYYYYARWLHSVGRSGEALAQVRRALELSPGHLDAQELLTSMLASGAAANAAAEPAPETAEQWLERSLTLYRLGRYQESAAAARRALEMRPNYVEAHNNICAAEIETKNYAAAVAACEAAVALRPGFELARNNLAVAKSRLGK